ncbi:MAG: hypothetical protein ACP5UD_10360 [Conexivisphaera sp.]
MPSGRVHDAVAELLLGVPRSRARKVNRMIDAKLALAIWGPSHRSKWGHDPVSGALIAAASDDPREALLLWALHMSLDSMPRPAQSALEMLFGTRRKVRTGTGRSSPRRRGARG